MQEYNGWLFLRFAKETKETTVLLYTARRDVGASIQRKKQAGHEERITGKL